MGAIEDTRKVLQDFLAPELRAITARLDALDKQMDALEKQVENVDRRAEQRHDMVMMAIGRVVDYAEVRERLARLESREAAHQTHQ